MWPLELLRSRVALTPYVAGISPNPLRMTTSPEMPSTEILPFCDIQIVEWAVTFCRLRSPKPLEAVNFPVTSPFRTSTTPHLAGNGQRFGGQPVQVNIPKELAASSVPEVVRSVPVSLPLDNSR